MRTHRTFIGISVMATVLLAAGCAGGDDNATGDAATPDAELIYASPLAKALSLGDAPDLATKQQELTASCMAERGWDYTPVAIPGGLESELGSLDEYANLFKETYRTKWGYGVSTIYADDGSYVDGAPSGSTTGTADPNEAYVASLSPSEQSRYYSDLFGAGIAKELAVPADDAAAPTIPGDAPAANPNSGDGVAVDPNVGGGSDLDTGNSEAPEGDLEQLSGSCTLAGLGAKSSDDLARLEQLSAKLADAANELGINSTAQLVKITPELQTAQQRWAECMGQAGHRVKVIDDPTKQLSKRLDEVLFGSADSPEPDLGGVTSVPGDAATTTTTAPTAPGTTGGGESEVVAGGGDNPGSEQATKRVQAFNPADVDIAALNRLQADELAMAKDDRDCQAEFFRPEYLKVRSAAEQRFVDRNGELLDELAKLTGLG